MKWSRRNRRMLSRLNRRSRHSKRSRFKVGAEMDLLLKHKLVLRNHRPCSGFAEGPRPA